ncbi:MAG: PilZ domain-containing protein [Desulfobulbus sp.]|nr:PilZ domain-containing protein [Desulfobulbus sp.]
MMVLGKKCPSCGGRQLLNRPPVARLAAFPTARAYACSDCQQQLIFLFPFSIGVENRHNVRKQMPPFFLVRISGSNNQYARINNLSEGGMCFQQQYNAPPLPGPRLLLDLYNCNDGSSLEQLPAEIVATNERLQEQNGHQSTNVSYSARFMHLNQAQRKVLTNCLKQYGTA